MAPSDSREKKPPLAAAEAQEEAVEWVGGVPLLVYLALQGLEACALCALPQLDRHKHVDAADAECHGACGALGFTGRCFRGSERIAGGGAFLACCLAKA